MAKTLIAAAREWNDGDVFKHSAAVSFDTLFSLAPITIIAAGFAGIFFGKEAAPKQFSEQMSQLVDKANAQVIQKAMEAPAGASCAGRVMMILRADHSTQSWLLQQLRTR